MLLYSEEKHTAYPVFTALRRFLYVLTFDCFIKGVALTLKWYYYVFHLVLNECKTSARRPWQLPRSVYPNSLTFFLSHAPTFHCQKVPKYNGKERIRLKRQCEWAQGRDGSASSTCWRPLEHIVTTRPCSSLPRPLPLYLAGGVMKRSLWKMGVSKNRSLLPTLLFGPGSSRASVQSTSTDDRPPGCYLFVLLILLSCCPCAACLRRPFTDKSLLRFPGCVFLLNETKA